MYQVSTSTVQQPPWIGFTNLRCVLVMTTQMIYQRRRLTRLPSKDGWLAGNASCLFSSDLVHECMQLACMNWKGILLELFVATVSAALTLQRSLSSHSRLSACQVVTASADREPFMMASPTQIEATLALMKVASDVWMLLVKFEAGHQSK